MNILESIHIIYCYSLDSKFIQQINNITKPFKLKSLFLNEIDELLEPLIQKSGTYLENLGTICRASQQTLQLFIKHCSKIKYLFPAWPDSQDTLDLIFSLLGNITQSLNYLLIGAFNNDYDNYFSSI